MRTDGGFASEEHIFPEALGNTELILPPGVVCDRCNNGVLSTLDKAVAEFMPVAMRRTMLGIQNKRGKIPRLTFSEGTLEHVPGAAGADPTLIFMPSTPRELLRETARHPDGRVELQWTASGGRRVTPRVASEISRGLLKSALEFAWLDRGAIVLESGFDEVRQVVLGKQRDGFLLVGLKADPNNVQGQLTYLPVDQADGTTRVAVLANLFGVAMATDSHLVEPGTPVPPDLASLMTFLASDLRT